MIDVTKPCPENLFAVTRERIRAGKGIVKLRLASYICTTQAGVRSPSMVQALSGPSTKPSYYTIDNVFVSEREAVCVAYTMARREARLELQRYEKRMARLNKSHYAARRRGEELGVDFANVTTEARTVEA